LVTDEEARSAAKEILSAGDFTRWHLGYEAWLVTLERIIDLIPDWLIDAVSWLEAVIKTLVNSIGDLLSAFGVFGDPIEGLGWLGVCFLAAVLIVLGWRWVSRSQPESGASSNSPRLGRDHATALQRARDLASRGHYLEASHRVQLAILALLIEFDWLELARSDPNRTLRERVRGSALPKPEGRRLIELIDRLEKLWFDEPREDQDLFEDWLSLDERLVRVATGARG